MAEWQGPALYCFNDSILIKPQDLYAISRIGQDSKLYKPYSIGRFGLGFYCVYHFTDIPGFVSGENIVIFDPHAFDLPGISPSQPYEEDIFLNNISFLHNVSRYAPCLEVHHLIEDQENERVPVTTRKMEKRNLSAWKLFLRILLLFSSLSIEFTTSNFSIFFLYQRVHSLLGLDPGVAIEIESVTAALSSVVGGARLL